MVGLCFLWGCGQKHLAGREPGTLQQGELMGQQGAGKVQAVGSMHTSASCGESRAWLHIRVTWVRILA